MAHTDIVKARAIRRAGHACEVCGTPVRFKSARLLEVKPLFGSLFDPDECCVLCERCWQDVEAERREGPPIAAEILEEMQRTLDAVEGITAGQEEEQDDGEHVVMQGPWGQGAVQRDGEAQARQADREERRRRARREEALRAAREAWFPPGDDDPDGGRCA